MKIQGGDHML